MFGKKIQFLGTSTQLQKLSHVCPTVCMEQIRSHMMDFYEIWYLSTFRKYVEKMISFIITCQ